MKPSEDTLADSSARPVAVEGADRRVVYLRPPVELGRLIAPRGGPWLVRVGGVEVELAVDASVAPNLLEDAASRGARVLVEHGEAGSTIAGVVMTQLPLSVDADGSLVAVVERLLIEARQGATLHSAGGMIRVQAGDVELYGKKVLTRAREVAQVLARMIRLN